MIHANSSVGGTITRLRAKPPGLRLARSLAATRYIDFPENDGDKDWRLRNCTAIRDGAVSAKSKLASWRSFLLALAGSDGESSARLLFARQESRLMVNLAGSVFENGGICLDRLSGVPYIPGSAVKGCARRLALAALREWASGELACGDTNNLLSTAIEGNSDPLGLLVRLARVFGWSDLEWSGSAEKSDFAWACGDQWQHLRARASEKLCERLGIRPKDPESPWKSLPHYAGGICFLPAFPWQSDPGIELDVVTCHHGEYYRGNERYAGAPDTEEPIPVVFPAVAPGETWVFAQCPANRAEPTDLPTARHWLALGLEVFGIGAKPNAGYGWFDASPDVTDAIVERGALQRKRTEDAIREQTERKKMQDIDEERRRAKEAESAATDGMTPDQKADWKLEQITDGQFEAKVRNFFKEPKKGGPSEEEKPAIVRALRGSKLAFWQEFKTSATKGDLAKAEQAIRALNKLLHGDKMP